MTMADDPPAKRGMGAHWADTNMIESNCFKCFSFRWIQRPMSRFLIVFSNFLPLYEEGSCLSTYPHRISDCSYSLASRWVLGGGGGGTKKVVWFLVCVILVADLYIFWQGFGVYIIPV